jgi:uncharacterized membrane protein required for colicin V production
MDILTSINWVDVLVVILILRTSYVAFKDGFSHEIFPLLTNITVVIVSLHFYDKMGQNISGAVTFIPVDMANFLSFMVIAIGLSLLFKLLKKLADVAVKVEWHPVVEKLGGIVIGVARSAMIASLVLIVLSLMPLSYLQRSISAKSLTGKYVLSVGPFIYANAYNILPFLRGGASSVSADSVLKKLESEKSIPVETSTGKSKAAEWEKVSNF